MTKHIRDGWILPIWNVGLEYEFFIGKKGLQGTTVDYLYNAQEVLKERLGFSIDQRGSGSIQLGNGYVLQTDGTAVEIKWFGGYNSTTIPTHEAIWRAIKGVKALEGFDLAAVPCLTHGGTSPWRYGCTIEFSEPGKTYASSKEIIDAYTGKVEFQEKKDELEHVKLRTAGLHLHFSLHGCHEESSADKNIFRTHLTRPEQFLHTHNLIKIADGIYNAYFTRAMGAYESPESIRRREVYQHLGLYRIRMPRENIGNLHTIEYRQLDASQYTGTAKFIETFQYESMKYLRDNIK